VGLVRSAAVAAAEFLDQLRGREDDRDGRAAVLLVTGERDGPRLDEARLSEVAGSDVGDGVHVDRLVGVPAGLGEQARELDEGHVVLGVVEREPSPATVGVVDLLVQLDHGGDEETRLPPAGAGKVEAGGDLVGDEAELDGRAAHLLGAEVLLRETAVDRKRCCGSIDERHANSGCSKRTVCETRVAYVSAA